MKKFVVFVLLFGICSFSQAFEKYSFGVKAGLNTVFENTIEGESFDTVTKPMTGYLIGGLISDSLGENYSIQAELLYSQRGYYVENLASGG